MADAIDLWRPRGPWADLVRPGRGGRAGGRPGVLITPMTSVDLALITAPSWSEDLDATLETLAGLRAPLTPRCTLGARAKLIWSGPERWLWLSADHALTARLTEALRGMAAVSNQSDAKALLSLEGPAARATLAKGLAIDLDPRVFATGDVAITEIGGIGVHLWQVSDAPAYELAVPRSLAASFWSWLTASAAEFGFEVRPGSGRG